MAAQTGKQIFVVEHLDPELGEWSALEYAAIARESSDAGAQFYLSSVSESLVLPDKLKPDESFVVEQRSIEELFEKKDVCLLDPSAKQELAPEDGDTFKVFLFGGILGRCQRSTSSSSRC